MNSQHSQIIPGVGQEAPVREPIPCPPGAGNVNPASLRFTEDFAIVDTETTGLDPDADAIIEIAVVRMRNGRREVFHSLVNPGFPIPPTSSAVNHITDEMVAGAPRIEDLRDDILHALDGAIPVAHNAAFDALFVDPAVGLKPDPESWICAMRLARHVFPQAPAFGNMVLRYWLKTNPDSLGLGAHRAADDCFVTFENLMHTLKACQERGIADLEGVLGLSNAPIYSERCPFYKHLDKPWADVPLDYVNWLLRERVDLDNDMKATLARELERRAAMPVAPATVMTFGKAHRDKLLAEVPTEYFEWMRRESKSVDPALDAGIDLELQRRSQGQSGTKARIADICRHRGGLDDVLVALENCAETDAPLSTLAALLGSSSQIWSQLVRSVPEDIQVSLKAAAIQAPPAARVRGPRP